MSSVIQVLQAYDLIRRDILRCRVDATHPMPMQGTSKSAGGIRNCKSGATLD
jgi:hypothetical protein